MEEEIEMKQKIVKLLKVVLEKVKNFTKALWKVLKTIEVSGQLNQGFFGIGVNVDYINNKLLFSAYLLKVSACVSFKVKD
jgi:hypothetical protein